MKQFIAIFAAFLVLVGCTKEQEVQLSSPQNHPVQIEVKGINKFQPIPSNPAIDLGFSSEYSVERNEIFKVTRSDGKLEQFKGYSFEARFHHYSKLLTVEYMTLDSSKSIKYYNNPIAWTSEEL